MDATDAGWTVSDLFLAIGIEAKRLFDQQPNPVK